MPDNQDLHGTLILLKQRRSRKGQSLGSIYWFARHARGLRVEGSSRKYRAELTQEESPTGEETLEGQCGRYTQGSKNRHHKGTAGHRAGKDRRRSLKKGKNIGKGSHMSQRKMPERGIHAQDLLSARRRKKQGLISDRIFCWTQERGAESKKKKKKGSRPTDRRDQGLARN